MVSTLLILVLAFLQHAEPARDLKLIKSEAAGGCSLIAEHYWSPSHPDVSRQIWLRPGPSSTRRILLTTYQRDADSVFSPDCTMIAVNDNLGSNIAEVRLFRRVSGVSYQPVPHANPTGEAWSSFTRTYRIGDLNGFLAHTYVNAVAWSSDSQALLLRAWGQTDPLNCVDAWYCVYDLRTNQVSTDLTIMNRNAVFVDGHPRR